jgi:glycosyltransferase involved in cell wall biosynthesis
MMKNLLKNDQEFDQSILTNELSDENPPFSKVEIPVILFITSYPPRECGIATYSQDLLAALKHQFNDSFELQVCALQTESMDYNFPEEVTYKLQTDLSSDYLSLARKINTNNRVSLVVIQHEFGLFPSDDQNSFQKFLQALSKPVITVFHTVLPNPEQDLKTRVENISLSSDSIIVMTNNAAYILKNDYSIPSKKIAVIPHGTHLVAHLNKVSLKERLHLGGKKVLATFGLIGSGKGIETTLDALPKIIRHYPETVFLIIGKTHPSVIASEGEVYRDSLKTMVRNLNLKNHVIFINNYLSLKDLLEYLQLTDIYLFTSRDPYQTVSGTFSYAMSCGCPIISTPIPHAKEVLNTESGIIIDFDNPDQLAKAVEQLLGDESLRTKFSINGLERMASTAWENSSIAHAQLFQKLAINDIHLQYSLPEINLAHFEHLTTRVGMIQFSKINQPDFESGYTLDDNARAMIAQCMHYELTGNTNSLEAIQTYLNFISFCQQPSGDFLNYVDWDQKFTLQNTETNLSDSNGRAIWGLGYLISKQEILPEEFGIQATLILQKAMSSIKTMHSPRSMAFSIKGLHFSNLEIRSTEVTSIIKLLADRLIQNYQHESEENWPWFESYLTYANSVLPEALLFAWKETGDSYYKLVAKASFDFLLSMTFTDTKIKLISNKGWLHKGHQAEEFGEQPIDVTYTILALDCFYDVFGDIRYFEKSQLAFSWFLGNNHLSRIIYNPCTGGCCDGLEQEHINLNQGAESTVSYLLARITVETQRKKMGVRSKASNSMLPQLYEEEFSLLASAENINQ